MSERARLQAVNVLELVLPARGEGQSLRAVLARRRRGLEPQEQGLMADLAFGVCRHYRLLDGWLQRHLKKPLKPSARAVHLALLAGLYELWFTERARHAVVNSWPDVCRRLKAPWASGLCNALLRNASRENVQERGADRPPAERYSVPDWLYAQWQQDWPGQAEAIARASATPPPLVLRCNRQRTTTEALSERLGETGLQVRESALVPGALFVTPARPVESLPGFDQGWFAVQDEAAQIPATLVETPDTGQLLDACAAPGGKTGQLAERFPAAALTALELDGARLRRVEENLERLGHRARLVRGDATNPAAWWDDVPFDAILVDAPCSATGILRRQPDSKWHRRVGDLKALCGLQADMLAALWPLVKPGGMLVYATCSVLKMENGKQVEAFLASHPEARDDTPAFAGAVTEGPGCQLLPEEGGHDGFFFARLRKQA